MNVAQTLQLVEGIVKTKTGSHVRNLKTDTQTGYRKFVNSETIANSEYDGVVSAIFDAHVEIFRIITGVIELGGH